MAPFMNNEQALPEHLQILRNMEKRSHCYEILSGKFSILSGIFVLGLGSWLSFSTRGLEQSPLFDPLQWLGLWSGALLFSAIIFLCLVALKCKQENTPLLTPGLRHSLRSMTPPILSSALIGSSLAWHYPEHFPLVAALWVVSYGVALLSTKSFTSRPLQILGSVELALGITFALLALRHGKHVHFFHLANFYLCLAFGIFPIIYGLGILLFSKIIKQQ